MQKSKLTTPTNQCPENWSSWNICSGRVVESFNDIASRLKLATTTDDRSKNHPRRLWMRFCIPGWHILPPPLLISWSQWEEKISIFLRDICGRQKFIILRIRDKKMTIWWSKIDLSSCNSRNNRSFFANSDRKMTISWSKNDLSSCNNSSVFDVRTLCGFATLDTYDLLL
jgi:hypothetical protein